MRDRRELRAVQDLVRIRVADAGEEARIGQRAFQRMVLAKQDVDANVFEIGVEDLDAPGIHRVERRLALNEMQRGAPLGAGLGESERAAVELEQRQGDLARSACHPSCRRPAIMRCSTR